MHSMNITAHSMQARGCLRWSVPARRWPTAGGRDDHAQRDAADGTAGDDDGLLAPCAGETCAETAGEFRCILAQDT